MAVANARENAFRGRVNGPADNDAFYRKWLATDDFYKKLFVSGVNQAPLAGNFDETLVPTMGYLAWYGRHKIVRPDKAVNKIACMVGSWADLFGPYINRDYICNEAESGQMIIAVVKELIVRDIDQISDATRASFIQVNNADDATRIMMWDHVFNGEGERNTAASATAILLHLAQHALPAFRIGGVSMLVHVYVSILKRGTMTETFTDKISEGMANDLGINNLQIMPEACRLFYNSFGTLINDTNIGALTTRWQNMLPVEALRLSLTVMQSCNSGITALIVIGRAIKIFTDFDWGRTVQLFQSEWATVTVAMTDVGNNQWYGFKHDLGRVASTRYKNIAYIAKELLIKVNGESSLKSYGGWTRRAKYQAVLDTLISDYETAKTESILRGQNMPEIDQHGLIIQLRDLITECGDVYVV